MPRAKARRLVVALCFGLAAVHIAVLVAVRVRETGAIGYGWKATWAYSASLAHQKRLESPDQVRCLETVCAVAPGTPLATYAALDEAAYVEGAEPPDLNLRIVRRELGRPSWPPGQPTTRLVRYGLRHQYYLAGRHDEERALAERALRELPLADRSYIHEWLAVLLGEGGQHEAAISHFESAVRSPHKRLHREAILAAAAAHRALGQGKRARVLEAQATSRDVLGLRRTHPPPRPASVGKVWARYRVADWIGADRARAHWWSVANADLEIVAVWLGTSLVLLALAAWPSERCGDSPIRPLVGGIALVATAGLLHVPPGVAAFGGMFYAASPANLHAALMQATSLIGYALFGRYLALTVVEGQSLRALGWRSGHRLWAWVLLGLVAGALSAAWGCCAPTARPLPPNLYFPGLGVSALVMALIAAFTEESLYRGYILPTLSRLTPRFWAANTLQALLFTAVHTLRFVSMPNPSGPRMAGMTVWWFGFGLFAGWLTRRSSNLWPAFACHLVLDAVLWYVQALPSYEILRWVGHL